MVEPTTVLQNFSTTWNLQTSRVPQPQSTSILTKNGRGLLSALWYIIQLRIITMNCCSIALVSMLAIWWCRRCHVSSSGWTPSMVRLCVHGKLLSNSLTNKALTLGNSREELIARCVIHSSDAIELLVTWCTSVSQDVSLISKIQTPTEANLVLRGVAYGTVPTVSFASTAASSRPMVTSWTISSWRESAILESHSVLTHFTRLITNVSRVLGLLLYLIFRMVQISANMPSTSIIICRWLANMVWLLIIIKLSLIPQSQATARMCSTQLNYSISWSPNNNTMSSSIALLVFLAAPLCS